MVSKLETSPPFRLGQNQNLVPHGVSFQGSLWDLFGIPLWLRYPPPIILQASTLGFEDWGPILESQAPNLKPQASTTMIRVRGLRPDPRTLSPKPRPQAQNLNRVRGFQPETSNPRPKTLNPKPKTSNPKPKTSWGSWFSNRNLEPVLQKRKNTRVCETLVRHTRKNAKVWAT